MSDISNLPVEVLSNINAFKFGKPEYIKIKSCHIEALKRIQNNYKITTTEPQTIYKYLKLNGGGTEKQVKREYDIERRVPFGMDSIESIINKQKEEILSLIYEEVEHNTDYQSKLDVFLDIRVRHKERKYKEGMFLSLSISFCSNELNSDDDDYETINENNINKVLNGAVKKLKNIIQNQNDTFYYFGIQSFGFRLILKENV